jgi:hypothetical protein
MWTWFPFGLVTLVSFLIRLRNKQVAQQTLEKKQFAHTSVPGWTSSILEQCLRALQNLNKPYKFVGMKSMVAFVAGRS